MEKLASIMEESDLKINDALDKLHKYTSWVSDIPKPQHVKRDMVRKTADSFDTYVRRIQADRNSAVTQLFQNIVQNVVETNTETEKSNSNLNSNSNAHIVTVTPKHNLPIALNKSHSLFCGINYIGSPNELKGCVDDADKLALFMQSRGWDARKCTRLDHRSIMPTHVNMISAFRTLLTSIAPGETGMFYYSGHGSFTKDMNNNETSGYDQVLLPVDMIPIVDDELKQMIQTYLRPNATLIVIMDCCFSGTALDLKYNYADALASNKFTVNTRETDTIGNVIMISGCNDLQTSAEVSLGNEAMGIMTWAFIECVTKSSTISWIELIQNMQQKLKHGGFTQIPQLTSGRKINVNDEISLVC
jgi:hypothetical protein